MSQRGLLRLLWVCLTLACVLPPTRAFGQGTTPQTLAWTGADNSILALNTPHPLTVTASSGLPVTLQVAYGPAALADGQLTITELGTVAVVAEQAGDATFAAVRETRVFNQRQAVLTPRGSQASANLTFDVAVAGNLAFLADWGAGVQIVDVSNPDNPVRVGLFNTPGQAFGVTVLDQRAYVADGTQGLQILDVSDPASPALLGALRTPGNAQKVQVVGNLAYMASLTAKLRIVDVTDPAALRAVGFGTHTGDALGVKVVGNHAYVAASTAGLHVFDVSNPAMPVRLATLGGLGEASAVDVVGNRACVVSSTGLQIIDVTNSATPVRLGTASLFVPEAPTGGGIFVPGLPATYGDVQIVGSLAYVANQASVLIVDLSDPAQPVRLGALSTLTDGKGLQLVGSRVYVGDATTGLRLLDARVGYPQTVTWTRTTAPSLALNQPHPIGAIASSGLPVTLNVAAGPATLADGALTITGPGIVTVAVEQAGNAEFLPVQASRAFNIRYHEPTEVGGLRFTYDGQRYSDVRVAGTRAYVLRAAGFDIVDVADPARPALLGSYRVPAGANLEAALALDVRDTTVLLTVGSRLEIVDASDPVSPVKLMERDMGGTAWDVQVAGNLAYVVAGAGFRILEVSNPANPVQRGEYAGGGNSGFRAIKVSGNLACLRGVNAGLHFVDVSNPTAPIRRSALTFPGQQVSAMDLAGTTAVASTRTPGISEGSSLVLFDLKNPAQPVRVGEYRDDSRGFSECIQLVDGELFRFGPNETSVGVSLQIFEINAPGSPLLVGTHFHRSNYLAGQVVGDHAYVVNPQGLHVLRLDRGFRQELAWTGAAGTLPLLGVGYPVAVTASSGLPVTLRLEFGPATLTGGILTATGPGLIQVTAEQPGDAAHLPVWETRSFNARILHASLRGSAPVPSQEGAARVRVVGPRAYVVDDGQYDGFRYLGRAFRVFDVSDPDRPALLGSLPLTGRIEALRVIGHLAYLADYGEFNGAGNLVGGGLRVLDVSDPARPVQAGALITDIGALGVDLAGHLAYLSDSEGLRILDVSDPASPTPVSRLEGFGATGNVRVAGTFAYLIDAQGDFAVVEVANPASPAFLGSVDLGDGIQDLEVSGRFAYVLTGGAGVTPGRLVVVDVSQPAQPTVIGRLGLPAGGAGLNVVGDIAYVAAGASGLRSDPGLLIVNVANPAMPVLLGAVDAEGSARSVDVVGDLAYLAVGGIGSEGLMVVEVGLTATGAAAPGLRLRRSGQQLELAWPAGLAGWQLQHRAGLAPEHAWQEVTASPVETGGEVRATVNATEAAGYFRLHRP